MKNNNLNIKIIENNEFFLKYWKYLLIGIFSLGLAIRLIFLPVNVPLTLDATSYLWYALDTKTLGYFPVDHGFPNAGWPQWLSLIFFVIPSSEILDYMSVQRISSVIISSLTIFPVFFLCKKYFRNSISLVGALFFSIEPHLILNSHLGITEPLFILFIVTSIVCVLSENKKLAYLGFVLSALATLVRYEGLLFLSVLSIMFFISYKTDSKKIIKYGLALSIFILVLLPFTYIQTQEDGLTNNVAAGIITPLKLTENEENQTVSLLIFVFDGFQNLVKYTGWVMIPYFIILTPIGIIICFKNKNQNKSIFIISIIVLSIPALYAYSRGIQETRYLLILIPFFTIFSLFFIEKIIRKENGKFIVIGIMILVIISSVLYVDYKKIDALHEKESYLISKQVGKLALNVNEFYPESKFLKIAYVEEYDFPIIGNDIPIIHPIETQEYDSIFEFIKQNQKNNLTHLVIDNNVDRKQFLKEVFNNEMKYPFLTKVFDSKDLEFDYLVKIFEIDYNKFSKYISE
ncbi:MAG: hypothetical protein COA77_03395 [Thaumarchaeota archaeon]|nr:MAG: hypothetical protein COA77_03395 [Nitrososphaerota archaeon]